VGIVNPDYNRKKHGGFYASMAIIAVSLFALSFSFLGESTLFHNTTVTDVYAQPYVETVKHRGLTIDLGNGVKTNAQLTIPVIGEGPFPGVPLIPGSGSTIVLLWKSSMLS
jgi:hypothetical protein